jgi:hypothetical protein
MSSLCYYIHHNKYTILINSILYRTERQLEKENESNNIELLNNSSLKEGRTRSVSDDDERYSNERFELEDTSTHQHSRNGHDNEEDASFLESQTNVTMDITFTAVDEDSHPASLIMHSTDTQVLKHNTYYYIYASTI